MTPEAKHLIAAGVKDVQKWLEPVQKACAEFQIDTLERIAGFVSQTAHESAGYTTLKENLNYSAKALAGAWPTRFAEIDPVTKKAKKDEKGFNIPNKFAFAIERKPETIANIAYGGRMGNGPIESGEGALYIGRGLKQLTGKENYIKCGKALGLDLVTNPDLLLENNNAVRSAGWFWSFNRCSEFADKRDVQGLTKRINGGLIGLQDRQKRFDAVMSA